MDNVVPNQQSVAPTAADRAGEVDPSLVPAARTAGAVPATSRSETTRRSNRTRRSDVPASPASTTFPTAPLVRPDGSPAPVIHLAPELSPYARTGGLGEAVASLARYQAASGIPVTVFMPLYQAVRQRHELQPVGIPFTVTVGPRTETARILEPVAPALPGTPRVLFVENEEYFDRPGLYGDAVGDYPDNAQRYALFARAVLVALPRLLPQPPSIVHAQIGRAHV